MLLGLFAQLLSKWCSMIVTLVTPVGEQRY